MLAIVHRCTRFHDYVFAKPSISVESDHRPLEAIIEKTSPPAVYITSAKDATDTQKVFALDNI